MLTRLQVIVLFSLFFMLSWSSSLELDIPFKQLRVPAIQDTTPAVYDGIEQVVAYKNWLFSGSKPTGYAGFNSLHTLNVRTIICVDGTSPNLKIPELYGMKTIHIPLKYELPSEQQIIDLATAVLIGKNRGNTYIHCHHGRHRSAAAATAALLALQLSTSKELELRMQVSETSKMYSGLWAILLTTTVVNPELCRINEPSLTSNVIPEGIVEQMTEMEFAYDNVIKLQKNNWKPIEHHPDLSPASEVGAIVESLRILQKSKLDKNYPLDFYEKLTRSLLSAVALENSLVTTKIQIDSINLQLNALERTCIACHAVYRR